MYYNDAEGDQSPIGISGVSQYEKAENYGRALMIKAFDLFQQIETKYEIVFNCNYTQVKLSQGIEHPSFMETGGAEYNLTPEALEVVLKVMSSAITSICAVRIGDLLIVGAPGELTAGLGLQVKNVLIENGIKYPTIGGLANE